MKLFPQNWNITHCLYNSILPGKTLALSFQKTLVLRVKFKLEFKIQLTKKTLVNAGFYMDLLMIKQSV